MDYIFVKFFGLSLGPGLNCFRSRSPTFGLKISDLNLGLGVSEKLSGFGPVSVSATSL